MKSKFKLGSWLGWGRVSDQRSELGFKMGHGLGFRSDFEMRAWVKFWD